MRCVSDATALPRIDYRRKHDPVSQRTGRQGTLTLPVMVVKLNKTSNVPPAALDGRLDFGAGLLSHRDLGQTLRKLGQYRICPTVILNDWLTH
jgi:hypothetical protein